MKKSIVIACVVVIAGGVIFGVAGYIADKYLTGEREKSLCHGVGAAHRVSISGNAMRPHQTRAARCDTLTITNNDTALRRIAFGQHDRHQAYDGVTEKVLKKGENLTVTLNQTGTFTLHDHLHDEVTGEFTVSDKE